MVFPGNAAITALSTGTSLSSPGGIAVDVAGNIFVADTKNNAVKEIIGIFGTPTVLTLGTATSFSSPGVAVDGMGNVIVADTNHSAVKMILKAGGYATVLQLAPAPFSSACARRYTIRGILTGAGLRRAVLSQGRSGPCQLCLLPA